MKEATWKIFRVDDNVGDVYVEFNCENKISRRIYKFTSKDALIEKIRTDAINFANNCLESSIDSDIKQQLISLTGTSDESSIDILNFRSFIK